ncbi:MAG: replication initiator protein A [Butyrivibrio sp.]|nr:replication initiator protein A [Butyrivibrio sp.]
MGKKLDLNYFTGQEADQFNFVKIPKPLLYDPIYAELKIAEIITYSMMLDRMNLSIKNGWFDELGRAYIFCSLSDVREFAGCGKNKAVEILKVLEEIGLIEKVKGAPGMGTRIYVKNFIPKNHQKFANQTFGMAESDVDDPVEDVDNSSEVCFSNHENPENQTSTFPKNKLLEVWKSNPSNNKYINTKNSNTESVLILSAENNSNTARCDDDEMGYAQLIKSNIELDTLLERYPRDRDFIMGLYELILETVICKSDEIVIASNRYSANFVKGKLLKLNFFHIQYVMDCWQKNTSKPNNVKKYLLASLFNAVSTMDAFYTAEVNHDMANGLLREG